MTESALARPFLIPSSQGGFRLGLQGAGGIPGIHFSRFWLSGGSKTAKEVFKMVPRHVSDSPRRTQDGPRRRQDSQDGSKALLRRPKTDPKSTKIHGKLMLRAIPISVSFFVRFLIDFQSIFRPQKFDVLLELYRFYSSFGLSGFVKIKWILQCIFEPTWFGF